jgi:hypothetical protein
MTDFTIYTQDVGISAGSEGTSMPVIGSKRGEVVVIDWLQKQIFNGRGFQNRAGTITTPIAGDVVITNSAAEMATSVNAGTTLIVINTNLAMRTAAGTLQECAGKSVGAIHTIGTAFVALPLKLGGPAAVSFSTNATAGGVAVAAELATTTRRHWSWSQPIAAGAYQTTYDWNPKVFSPLVGPYCYYVQVAATTTAPDYYASYDFIELPTVNV